MTDSTLLSTYCRFLNSHSPACRASRLYLKLYRYHSGNAVSSSPPKIASNIASASQNITRNSTLMYLANRAPETRACAQIARAIIGLLPRRLLQCPYSGVVENVVVEIWTLSVIEAIIGATTTTRESRAIRPLVSRRLMSRHAVPPSTVECT